MSDGSSFEPYIDWDSIDDEMTDEFYLLFVRYREVQQKFHDEKSRKNAAEFLRVQHELSNVAEAIHRTLFTVPMMVHIAGPKTALEDSDEEMIQRCKRCGSNLQYWREGIALPTPDGDIKPFTEDMVTWWEEDAVIAKANGNFGVTMYAIDKDRALEPYEKPCPDFAKELGS